MKGCTHPSLVIFRKKGNRVRMQCSDCVAVFHWQQHRPVEEAYPNMSTLTIPQLLKFAEDNNIDVRKSWTKSRIIEAISNWTKVAV